MFLQEIYFSSHETSPRTFCFMNSVPQVAELITGLQELGCTRTTGEDQTVCVMTDSFDYLGNVADLQASGDLPQVEVVKVRYE